MKIRYFFVFFAVGNPIIRFGNCHIRLHNEPLNTVKVEKNISKVVCEGLPVSIVSFTEETKEDYEASCGACNMHVKDL